ncbi:MAG: hypothetical protein M1127_01580 [Patescibacteria group bacterium]|nr:hypothetical protein [Patescibacteria group bacterium]
MLKNIRKFLLDIFFPQFCLNCKKEGEAICEDCLHLIGLSPYQFCPFCSPPKRVVDRGKCEAHRNYKLNGLFSAVSYQEPLAKKLIANFKYGPCLKTLSSALSYLIISHFLLSENKFIFEQKEKSIFIPAPLAKRKQKKRGFNQAELLSAGLSGYFQIPLITGNLVKIKNTASQVGLNFQQRAENVKNVFAVRNPSALQNKIVFLVDDVFTTGSTMEECARVLKAAGASQVWGIAIAREPLQ